MRGLVAAFENAGVLGAGNSSVALEQKERPLGLGRAALRRGSAWNFHRPRFLEVWAQGEGGQMAPCSSSQGDASSARDVCSVGGSVRGTRRRRGEAVSVGIGP